MKTVFQIVKKVSTILGIISMVLVVFMLLFIVVGVLARLIFNAPFSGSYEVVQIALALMIFASLSYTQVRRRHVCISMLIKLLPETGRYIDSAIVSLLGAVICGVIAVSFYQQGIITLGNGQCTQTLFIPMFPVYFISCVLMAAFGVTLVIDIVKSVMAACGNQECREDLQRSWV